MRSVRTPSRCLLPLPAVISGVMTAVRLALAVAATGLSVATAFVPHLPLTNARNLVTPTCASRTNAVRMSAAVAPVGTAKDLSRAADEARGLAMDSISAAHSGHLGLPLGAAEIGAVLFGRIMNYNPEDPQWLNRDRFILSAGHGSMFIYSWLHLAGYALPLEEVKKFRQHHSMTPGHPEFPSSQHNTPGIESTTGPLGQGVSNAVGMAAAQKAAAAVYNTDKHTIFDSHIIALAGDGCIQEGVAAESAAFAAHEKLDNLIILYDANDVTLDAMADRTQSEDVAMRYTAYGWEVMTINGHDLEAAEKALSNAKKNDNGKPKLIICKTIIGKGIDEVAGTNAAHGEAGVKFTDASRKRLGLPEEKWYVSPDTRAFFQERKKQLKTKYDAWNKTFAEWKAANPDKAKLLASAVSKEVPSAKDLLAKIPEFDASKSIATREAGAVVLQSVAAAIPNYISGSADLHGSTKNYIKNGGDFGKGEGKSYAGRNVLYGIREHAMGAILNGFAYFGLHRVSGATFLVFADYMRASVRVAALSELPVGYIWTHDSVGVGEDGPTHQPVETVSGLRVIPNLDVIRPADPEETAGAFVQSIVRKDGPTALILTRQNVKVLPIDVKTKREGVAKGAYIAHKETGALKLILLASGSEVQHAMDAAKALGDGVRVVSVPCFEIFDRQSAAYKEEVLPSSCRKRLAMEAGVTNLWYKYVGLDGKVIGTDSFGFSAPGDIVFKEFGITADNFIKEAKAYM